MLSADTILPMALKNVVLGLDQNHLDLRPEIWITSQHPFTRRELVLNLL